MYSTTMIISLANIPDEQLFFEDRKGYATCVICMELIKETDTVTLKCGHQYHASCYSENILSGNNHCALCRDEVCRKAYQLPDLSKEMISSFMEELLLYNRGARIKEVFKDLGYEITDLNASHYNIIVRLLIDFGFNLGAVIRDWIDDGNDRYVHDYSDNIINNIEHFTPREVFQNEYDDNDTDPDMPPLEYSSDGDEEEEIQLYPIHLWSSSEMEEDREPQEQPPLLLRCFECGEDDRGALEEDLDNPGTWYCEDCWDLYLYTINQAEEGRDPDEGPATPPESNSDTGGEPIPQDDDVPYEELYDHLIARDRTEMKDFIEKYNLQEYEERIFGHPIYRTVDLLISRDIDELMWPSGWSGRRPYFTIEEANKIFGAILRYHSEGYNET